MSNEASSWKTKRKRVVLSISEKQEIIEMVKAGTKQADVELNSGIACCVCGSECGRAHRCIICERSVHAFCGKPVSDDDEGYGRPITCLKCLM